MGPSDRLPFLWFVSLHPKEHKGKQRNERVKVLLDNFENIIT